MYSSDGRKRKEYAIAENNGALFCIIAGRDAGL